MDEKEHTDNANFIDFHEFDPCKSAQSVSSAF